MKLINLLEKIENDEIKPIIYFRINTFGYNFIIKYLYFHFIIIDVEGSFKNNIVKNKDFFDEFILYSLNKNIEIIGDEKIYFGKE